MNWRRLLIVTLAMALLGVALLAGISHWSDSRAGENKAYYAADASALSGNIDRELIARGEYLAKLGDCGACHSTPGHPPFSGGLKMGLPIGAIYTTNITPDTTYGIGRFTLADFDRALRFGVAASSVVKWSQRHRATGSVAPGKMGGHRKPVLDPYRDFIVERIAHTSHLTLHKLKDELAARGVIVSHNAVWLFLRREGLRFKKNSVRP